MLTTQLIADAYFHYYKVIVCGVNSANKLDHSDKTLYFLTVNNTHNLGSYDLVLLYPTLSYHLPYFFTISHPML